MTNLPDEQRLLQAMDKTWAPAEIRSLGPWTIRRGLNGGKRVSAATSDLPVTSDEIDQAETAMRAMDQPELFMLREQNSALDKALEGRGYKIVDPVLLFAAPAHILQEISTNPHDGITSPFLLALMQEIWHRSGIKQPRIEVMKRSAGPKAYMFSRVDQTPGAVAFIAVDNEIAMLHALEVAPKLRRQNVARKAISRAAIWAIENNAEFLSVAVTSENTPACSLYAGLGMQVVGKYHYRMK